MPNKPIIQPITHITDVNRIELLPQIMLNGMLKVSSEMSANAGKYKSNLEYDCSEIAEDLAQAAGGKGEIITIMVS
ncbi:hypothetical protein KB559_16425 [Paenibacillus sp. Marseille-P2973]|nr:hypothetical protein [Paenibacillus sp. Marseille-P2973]